LGEDYCSWDDGAIGPALSEDDVQLKKAKALEKKRRQRARQKEKKAIEKAEAEAVATKERAELEKKKQEEDAKRIRDGLKPKPKAQNACDFCHKIVKGKRRSQMFQRLEYAYCSTDCVKKHQRELMAAAAVARFSNH
jgi:sRNA-binding protein